MAKKRRRLRHSSIISVSRVEETGNQSDGDDFSALSNLGHGSTAMAADEAGSGAIVIFSRLSNLVRLFLNMGSSDAPIQIAFACQWPPIIEEYFEWPPIGNPAEDEKTLFNKPFEGNLAQETCCQLGQQQAHYERNDPDEQRTPADTEELVEIALNCEGT
jgi:hypothetical protein